MNPFLLRKSVEVHVAKCSQQLSLQEKNTRSLGSFVAYVFQYFLGHITYVIKNQNKETVFFLKANIQVTQRHLNCHLLQFILK